jgi:hypothetical protein
MDTCPHSRTRRYCGAELNRQGITDTNFRTGKCFAAFQCIVWADPEAPGRMQTNGGSRGSRFSLLPAGRVYCFETVVLPHVTSNWQYFLHTLWNTEAVKVSSNCVLTYTVRLHDNNTYLAPSVHQPTGHASRRVASRSFDQVIRTVHISHEESKMT